MTKLTGVKLAKCTENTRKVCKNYICNRLHNLLVVSKVDGYQLFFAQDDEGLGRFVVVGCLVEDDCEVLDFGGQVENRVLLFALHQGHRVLVAVAGSRHPSSEQHPIRVLQNCNQGWVAKRFANDLRHS